MVLDSNAGTVLAQYRIAKGAEVVAVEVLLAALRRESKTVQLSGRSRGPWKTPITPQGMSTSNFTHFAWTSSKPIADIS